MTHDSLLIEYLDSSWKPLLSSDVLRKIDIDNRSINDQINNPSSCGKFVLVKRNAMFFRLFPANPFGLSSITIVVSDNSFRNKQQAGEKCIHRQNCGAQTFQALAVADIRKFIIAYVMSQAFHSSECISWKWETTILHHGCASISRQRCSFHRLGYNHAALQLSIYKTMKRCLN